jgi:hypothetical protein
MGHLGDRLVLTPACCGLRRVLRVDAADRAYAPQAHRLIAAALLGHGRRHRSLGLQGLTYWVCRSQRYMNLSLAQRTCHLLWRTAGVAMLAPCRSGCAGKEEQAAITRAAGLD